MTSDRTPGTAVPERAVAAVATLGALVLLAGVALSARGPATADLPTLLLAADPGTVLVTAAGQRPARAGDTVPDGARVRTTATGVAALSTDGRSVRLAPGSEVVVVDGARQRLERGAVLVDTAAGPAVRLTAAGSTVSVGDDALVRVDRERLLRVAAYDGRADVTAPGRRRTLDVRELHQLQVAAGGLAGPVVPLALREGDTWERQHVARLVEDDRQLNGWVRTLAGAPEVLAAALPSGERPQAVQDRAELALTNALAHDDGRFELDTFLQLQEGRSLGGSWGVVAVLAETGLAEAERFLDRGVVLEGLPGAVLAAGDPAAFADEVLGALPGLVPDSDTPPVQDATRPGGPESRPSTPRPQPSGQPGEPERDPVGEVVDTVRDLLPLPVPEAPGAPVRPPLQVEVPRLDVSAGDSLADTLDETVDDRISAVVNGIVGGVLGR